MPLQHDDLLLCQVLDLFLELYPLEDKLLFFMKVVIVLQVKLLDLILKQ
jgi:hypothetical protein